MLTNELMRTAFTSRATDGQIISGLDFQSLDLTGAHFRNCDFDGCLGPTLRQYRNPLGGVFFRSCHFKNTDFRGCRLTYNNFSGCSFSRCLMDNVPGSCYTYTCTITGR